ncbi:MAG: DinB family protein [Bacteroidota bacterium]
MNEAMMIALKENTNTLAKALSAFDYVHFNRHPADGGWTAGEIAEHLLLFDLRITNVFSGKTAPSDRDPQANINAMQDRMADRVNRIDAPTFLVPSTTAKDPVTLTQKILDQRCIISIMITDQDITVLLPDSPHRFYGIMSAVEWVQFLIHHCNRHIEQLRELAGS